MDILFVVLLLMFTGYAVSLDREKLAIQPRGMSGFNVERETGLWYYQAFLAPCSWSGSKDFTDDSLQIEYMHGDNFFTATESWRSGGICATVQSRVTFAGNSTCTRINKDSIGDVTSGKDIAVATDYKSFIVYWGCTKEGIDGKCEDPWVDVVTRKKYPRPYTLKIVERILKHLWDLSLTEMVRVKHDKG